MRIFEFEQTKVPSLEDVAARVGLSPFHFSRLFTTATGESCKAYSRRIRLENSNNQLMHDPVPLALVATWFGYASQAAYTRAFARHFGMPPARYAAQMLGRTQADYAASQLGPAHVAVQGRIMPEPVKLVRRNDRPALARRFYGHGLADHWRRFLAELPDGIADKATLAGMAYDSPRATPPEHWRYDCALVFEDGTPPLTGFDDKFGLDLVEVPGGLHAEVECQGGFMDLWRATVGLFTEWLPANEAYRTEGDPVVQWLHDRPTDDTFTGTATIRIYPRDDAPTLNLRPLTPFGRPAGYRTPPTEV